MLQKPLGHPLIAFAAAMLWLKTYIVQKFYYNLPVSSGFQEFILWINPLSSALLLLVLGFWIFKYRAKLAMVMISFISSLILCANIIFYRFYNDFITLPVLFQGKNLGDLGASIVSSWYWWDAWLFIDTAILLLIFYGKKSLAIPLHRQQLVRLFSIGLIVFLVNWGFAEIARPGVMIKSFDRHTLVKSIGQFNYHVHDMILNSRLQTKKVLAKSSDLQDAEEYIEENVASDHESWSSHFGIAEGKNVILISLESMHQFVLGRTVQQQEITPFLNELLEDSFVATNFYQQTGQGKTSDSEFIVDNALYPTPSGAVFFTHATNSFLSLPHILTEHDYYSAVFHANDGTFWNREAMYDAQGYDRFITKQNYIIDEQNVVGWGLKDIDFFEQSMLHLKYLPQPFYSKFITLTNHHPFELAEEDWMIPEFDPETKHLNHYFATVRYMDEAVKVFFQRLKEQGLYENSIIVLYGDHYGISPFYYPQVAKFLGLEEITPVDHIELQKVPLIIHIPGYDGKLLEHVSGQIDLRATILGLLGIELEEGLYFGQNMLSYNKESFAVLRDGSFITEDHIYTQGTCYLKDTGEVTTHEACEELKLRAEADLENSDKIIYGDLLRFAEEDS